MTITIGSFMLMVCSLVTGLLVEAIKQLVDVKKPNIVAAIVSVVVGIAIPIGYIILKELPIDTTAVLYTISLVVLSFLCSTLGYDKVIQTLNQLKR